MGAAGSTIQIAPYHTNNQVSPPKPVTSSSSSQEHANTDGSHTAATNQSGLHDNVAITIKIPANMVNNLLTTQIIPKVLAPATQQDNTGGNIAVPRKNCTCADHKTGFLDLPAEIRNTIYELVLCESDFIKVMLHKHKKYCPRGRVARVGTGRFRHSRRTEFGNPCDLDIETGKWVRQAPSAFTILQTCRLVREEAGFVAYSKNAFWPTGVKALEQFLLKIGDKQRSWIRCIRLPSELKTRSLKKLLGGIWLAEMRLDALVFESMSSFHHIQRDEASTRAKDVAFQLSCVMEPFFERQLDLDKRMENAERLKGMLKLWEARVIMCERCMWNYYTGRNPKKITCRACSRSTEDDHHYRHAKKRRPGHSLPANQHPEPKPEPFMKLLIDQLHTELSATVDDMMEGEPRRAQPKKQTVQKIEFDHMDYMSDSE